MDVYNKLDNETFESLLYLGYFSSKTQSELTDFIYNVIGENKTIKRRKYNINPIIAARKKLEKEGFIKRLDSENIKNIRFQSTPKPYIEYLDQEINNNKFTTKPKDHRITDLKLKYIDFFIDSSIFRNVFFNNKFLNGNNNGYHRGIIYLNDKGRYSVKSAFTYMNIVFCGLVGIPSAFVSQYCDNEEYEAVITPKLDINYILNNYNSFDDFYRDFIQDVEVQKILYNILKSEGVVHAFEYLDGDNDKMTEYYFNNVIKNGLFLTLPPDISETIAFLSLSRLHTVYTAFSNMGLFI